MLSAEEILRIPLSKPELLFSNKDTFKRDMVTYSHFWNPDADSNKYRETQCRKIITHITNLYIAFQKKKPAPIFLFKGIVQETSTSVIYTPNGIHTNPNSLNWYSFIRNHYWKDNYKEKYLPGITINNDTILIKKSPDFILLKSFEVDIGSLYWIMLHSLRFLIWLEDCNKSYGQFTVNDILVNPHKCSIDIIGGWWNQNFHTQYTGKDLVLVKSLLLNLIKQIKEECPKAILNWISVHHKDSRQAYFTWKQLAKC